MKSQQKIKFALEVQYIQGICFICKGECEEKAYCHSYCARAYSEDKDRILKEINKEIESEN